MFKLAGLQQYIIHWLQLQLNNYKSIERINKQGELYGDYLVFKDNGSLWRIVPQEIKIRLSLQGIVCLGLLITIIIIKISKLL